MAGRPSLFCSVKKLKLSGHICLHWNPVALLVRCATCCSQVKTFQKYWVRYGTVGRPPKDLWKCQMISVLVSVEHLGKGVILKWKHWFVFRWNCSTPTQQWDLYALRQGSSREFYTRTRCCPWNIHFLPDHFPVDRVKVKSIKLMQKLLWKWMYQTNGPLKKSKSWCMLIILASIFRLFQIKPWWTDKRGLLPFPPLPLPSSRLHGMTHGLVCRPNSQKKDQQRSTGRRTLSSSPLTGWQNASPGDADIDQDAPFSV